MRRERGGGGVSLSVISHWMIGTYVKNYSKKIVTNYTNLVKTQIIKHDNGGGGQAERENGMREVGDGIYISSRISCHFIKGKR